MLLACKVLGLKNDIAWTVLIHMSLQLMLSYMQGSKIDFVDIDLNTYNISLKKLEKKLELAKKKNQLPKLLIPVHFGGLPCI